MYAMDLDHFINEFKKENIYLIARIVTFKDRTLSRYANGKYAVLDKTTNQPWLGIKGYEEIKDEAGTVTGKETLYYDEHCFSIYFIVTSLSCPSRMKKVFSPLIL